MERREDQQNEDGIVVIDRTRNIFGKTERKTELIIGRTECSKKPEYSAFYSVGTLPNNSAE